MKWLITGGAGFIGTNTAEALVHAGERCVLADNFHRSGAKYNQEYLRERCGLRVDYLDVRFADQVNAYWQAHGDAEVVLHLAGQVSLVASVADPRYDFDTNALGTFNVLEATRRFLPKAKLIYASTNKVYGDLRKLGTKEDTTRHRLPDFPDGLAEDLPIDLHGGYSCSKGAADQYVLDYHRMYGLSTVTLRQSSIYGGRQYASEDQGWVSYFVQMGVERRRFRISGDGKQVRDLLHVSDLVECYRAVASSPRESLAFGQAFNLGGGPQASLSLVELFIVIVNHNHRLVIEKCIESLYSLLDRAAFEVMLVDNTGADGTPEWAARHFPQVMVRRNAVRRGFAANVNAGINALAQGRYVLLLNPDVICLAGLLDQLVRFLDAHPKAAIAAPQLYYPDGTMQPNVRRFPTPATLALRALHVDAVWKSRGVRRYLMHGEPAVSQKVDWVTGAVMMVRREAIGAVGSMDESYFLYWEDLDWCYRMRRAGWSVHRVAEARAIHAMGREGAHRPFSRAGREQVAGAIRFFRKFGWNAGKAA